MMGDVMISINKRVAIVEENNKQYNETTQHCGRSVYDL